MCGKEDDLEEKGIQELAKLKLTLSNRQFAIRKKEIQKDLRRKNMANENARTEKKTENANCKRKRSKDTRTAYGNS